jgi:hypothetical protein
MLLRGRRAVFVIGIAVVAVAAALPARTWGASSPDDLQSAGGPVMPSTTTYAIYWLPSGVQFEPSGSDSSYEALIQRFLGDVGDTDFYTILTQYAGASGTIPTNSSTFGGSYLDTTSYPEPGTVSAPLHDADIQAAVSHAMTAKGWTADPAHLFLVYTGYNIQGCHDSGGEQCSADTYCAYHSWFVPSGGTQAVFYAALPDAGGNNGTCLARGAGGTYPNGDASADSEVSLTSKELFAAASDPEGNGWIDPAGADIGDKCDGDFGTIASDGSNVTLNNGHKYLVQREWSNAAGGCALSYLGRDNRATPTLTVVGTATPTPTAIAGRSSRSHWYSFLERAE